MKFSPSLWSLVLSFSVLYSAELEIGVKPGLKFDLAGFHLQPGEELTLTFTNNDEMMHNIVFTKPEKRLYVVEAAIAMGAEGFSRNFVPEIPEVLAYTPIVQPGEKFVLKFNAPTEPGQYPYVCTFPGHGYVMHGTLFVTKDRPEELIKLLNEAQEEPSSEVADFPLSKAKLMRTFMPESSPAAIAVALPGGHSYCWDAGNCRLRYVWRGGFIKRNGSYGRWRTLPTILGQIYYREPKLAFRFEGEKDVPATKFLGYRFLDGIPEFRYKLGECEVREFLAKLPGKSGVVRHFSLSGLGEKNLFFQKDAMAGVEILSNKGTWYEKVLKLTPVEAKSFTLTMIEIPNQAPVKYWSMDDLTRSFTKEESLVEGHLGRAWQFGGTSPISTSHEFLAFKDAFALSAWIKINQPEGWNSTFCGWGEPGSGPAIYYDGSGAGLQFGIRKDLPQHNENLLEAESAKVKGAAITYKNSGYSGTGYVDFNAKAGESIEWTSQIEKSGQYLLRFRYAVAGGSRSLKVELNDTTITDKGNFADTGSWTSWKNLDIPVTLIKGKQTVRLTSNGFSGPNVDYLAFISMDLDTEITTVQKEATNTSHAQEPQVMLEKGIWNHVVANFTQQTATLYLNGKPVRRLPFATDAIVENAKFYLGSSALGKPYWMDEVRLFARSLSEDEIKELNQR